MAQVIALSGQKGGVGKTSIATNVACSLALGTTSKPSRLGRKLQVLPQGRRVLVVDVDRQQSAGDSLGIRGMPNGESYIRAIGGEEVDFDKVIFQAPFELERGSIDVMPIDPYSYEVATQVITDYPNSGIDVFHDLLASLQDDYDYIVLDLRPELSHMTASAAAACNGGVILPVVSEVTTAIHAQEVVDHISYAAKSSGRAIPVLGIVRSKWEARTEEARDVEEFLQTLDVPVFETTIPNHRVVSKSFSLTSGPSVTSYPKAPSTKKFHELTAEIVAKVEGN